jgi:hypothetical protein
MVGMASALGIRTEPAISGSMLSFTGWTLTTFWLRNLESDQNALNAKARIKCPGFTMICIKPSSENAIYPQETQYCYHRIFSSHFKLTFQDQSISLGMKLHFRISPRSRNFKNAERW